MANGLVLGWIDLSLGFFFFGNQAPLWIALFKSGPQQKTLFNQGPTPEINQIKVYKHPNEQSGS